MAVSQTPRQLFLHSLPVLIVIGSLSAVSAIILSGHSNLGLDQAEQSAIKRDLLTRVLQIKPTANGLAEVTFAQPPSLEPASPSLQAGFAQTGRLAQLSLELHNPELNN